MTFIKQSSITKTIHEAIDREQRNIDHHLKELESAIIRKKTLEAGVHTINEAATAAQIKDSIDALLNEATPTEVN